MESSLFKHDPGRPVARTAVSPLVGGSTARAVAPYGNASRVGAPIGLGVSRSNWGGREEAVDVDLVAEHGLPVAGTVFQVSLGETFVRVAGSQFASDSLSEDQEADLHRHYGLVDERESVGDIPTPQSDFAPDGAVGYDTPGPTTDEAMTRSEEQVRVGTEKVQAGKARLRKYIVAENVTTKSVAAMDGPDLSEEVHEVNFTEERVVVSKGTVPVERVKLAKESITEDQVVSEEVDKQQNLALLKGRGEHDKATQAEADLPDQIDTDQDSGPLSTFGINPADLLGGAGGGIAGKLGL